MRHRWRLLDHVESTVCSLLKCVRLFIWKLRKWSANFDQVNVPSFSKLWWCLWFLDLSTKLQSPREVKRLLRHRLLQNLRYCYISLLKFGAFDPFKAEYDYIYDWNFVLCLVEQASWLLRCTTFLDFCLQKAMLWLLSQVRSSFSSFNFW